MPKALATEDQVADACDGGIYGKLCADFPDLEEGDKCEVAQSPLDSALLEEVGIYHTLGSSPTPAPTKPPAPAPTPDEELKPAGADEELSPAGAPTPADCRNATVFQKLSGKVGFANIELCGGEKANCYIDNVCEEPTTTITTTTKTITTSTTTTVVYECHCRAFAEGQGPGCSGKCCVRKDNEGGEGFDTDCSTETDENGCNERLNGANQNFCVYKRQSYWKSLAR